MSRFEVGTAGGLRLFGVGFLLAGYMATGCGSCIGGPGVETLLSVDIVQPAERQVLGIPEDADPNTSGLQYDVKAHVKDSGNKPFTLASATLQFRAAGTEAWTDGPTAVISGADITFPHVTLPKGDQDLRVDIKDQGTERTATRTLTVTVQDIPDPVLSVSFVQPADQQTLSFADDVDVSTPGFQYDVKAHATDSADRAFTLATATLELRAAGTQTWTAGPTASITGADVSFPHVTLPPGSQELRITLSDQGANRTASKSITVNVNTARPVVTAVSFQNDANSDNRLNSTELATGAPVVLVTATGLEDGQPVRVKDAVSGTVYGEVSASGGQASIPLSALALTPTTETDYPLAVELVSRSGLTNNLTTGTPSDPRNDAAFTTLRVDRVAPTVSISSPSSTTLALADDGDLNQAGFQIRLAFTVPADVGASGVQVVHTPGNTTQPAPASGQVVEVISVPWSATSTTYSFQITATDNSGNASSPVTYNVTVPAFIIGGRVTGGDGVATLFVPPPSGLTFVASTNTNLYASPSHPGYVVDKVPGGNAEADFSFTVQNTAGASAEITYNGSSLGTAQAISGSNQILTFNDVVLPQNTNGPVGVRVFLPSGAEVRFSLNATVDVQPPAASTVTYNLVTSAPFSSRKPALDLSWPASNDDGETSTGSPVGFDVRWSTDAIVASGIATEQVFHDSSLVQEATATLLSPSTGTYRITGLPSFGRYFVQVRAIDEVGNYAPLSTTASFDHPLSVQSFPNQGFNANKFGNYLVANGSLNNDGIDDLVASENVVTQPGRVFVIYGKSDLSTATVQPILPPDSVSQFFGTSISVGNAGDPPSTPAKADLLVSGSSWNNRGRVMLYFGQAGAATLDTTDNIEFRGTATGGSFGGTVRIIDDLNGDGLGEVVIAAHGENAPRGRVYVFNGRDRDAWRALRVTDASDNALVVTPAQADRVIDGPAFTCATERPLAGCPGTLTNPSLFFGRKNGYASLGDVNGDGVGDFAIPQSRDFVDRVFIQPGGTGSALQTLIQDDPSVSQSPGTSVNLNGFGAEAFGAVDLLGSTASDLAVSYPSANRVYLYPGGGPATQPFSAAPTILNGSGFYGFSLAHGDIDGDGRQDLVMGSNNSVAAGGSKGAVYVLYNTGVAGSEFDRGAGTAIGASATGFHQSRWLGVQALGVGVATGDFNGDGVTDVAAGDWLDGCTVVPPAGAEQCSANPGKVFIRY